MRKRTVPFAFPIARRNNALKARNLCGFSVKSGYDYTASHWLQCMDRGG